MKRLARNVFPDKRLYLKTERGTRLINLSTGTQIKLLLVSTVLVGWSVVSTSVILMDTLGSGNSREQALARQELYTARLNTMAEERDRSSAELHRAHQRFQTALQEVSQMQTRLLASEDRRLELETGIETIQATLRRTVAERDAAKVALTEIREELTRVNGTPNTEAAQFRDLDQTVGFLTEALNILADSKDDIITAEAEARAEIAELQLTQQLTEERNARIFEKLEDAVQVSLEPLDKMFRSAGVPTDRIIDQVRRGYTGQGGPLLPISMSTRSAPPDANTLRAAEIFAELEQINIYRMAAERLPFAMPVQSAFRFTSGFGYRRDPKGGGGRMHAGTDFAAATGTPIYASADGVVVHAGWQSGYGRLVKIKHEFGFETRYAHLSRINVKKGQRVSRGDRIGGMGSSGRSTGTHLHYEVRQNGTPVNPMTFIKAGQDVF